jgi:membrane protein implicated in regulation of membrane protease activity
METLFIILLLILVFLLVIAAMLAGAVGIAYALRWVWPAIDLGSATIVGLISLLAAIYLASRVARASARDKTGTNGDEDDEQDEDDEELVRRRRMLLQEASDEDFPVPRRRRRRRRG